MKSTPNAPSRTLVQRLRRSAGQVLLAASVFVFASAWQTRGLLPSGTVVAPPGAQNGGAASSGNSSKVKLVYFFAPWCGVCKVASANVALVFGWLGESRLEVIATALDYQSPNDVRAYEAEHPFPHAAVLGDDATRDAYHVNAYPTYYILDANNVVRGGTVGYSTALGMLVRIALASI